MDAEGRGPSPDERAIGARLTITRALVVYGAFVAAAWVGSAWFLERAPFTAPGVEAPALWVRVVAGAAVGVAVVAVDRVLERFVPIFRRMGEALKGLLGSMTAPQAVFYALASSVGEEILFRGALQVWLGIIPASILFGLMHVAPDRRLWPWPLIACAMGFAFGGLFEYTGDVIAPILAHFTINYFGFMRLRELHAAAHGTD